MLETRNLDKSFGAVHVTRGVSLKLERGERRVIQRILDGPPVVLALHPSAAARPVPLCNRQVLG